MGHYIDPDDRKNPRASPLFRTDEEFTKLPPALLILAELDMLRDMGYGM